jgi:hypothetical protein
MFYAVFEIWPRFFTYSTSQLGLAQERSLDNTVIKAVGQDEATRMKKGRF